MWMIKAIQSKDRKYQMGLNKQTNINYSDVMFQFNMATIGDS